MSAGCAAAVAAGTAIATAVSAAMRVRRVDIAVLRVGVVGAGPTDRRGHRFQRACSSPTAPPGGTVSRLVDWEAEGLLDELPDDRARQARRELLDELHEEGVGLEELKQAVAEQRLALLPVERLLGSDQRYSQREIAEQAGDRPRLPAGDPAGARAAGAAAGRAGARREGPGGGEARQPAARGRLRRRGHARGDAGAGPRDGALRRGDPHARGELAAGRRRRRARARPALRGGHRVAAAAQRPVAGVRVLAAPQAGAAHGRRHVRGDDDRPPQRGAPAGRRVRRPRRLHGARGDGGRRGAHERRVAALPARGRGRRGRPCGS